MPHSALRPSRPRSQGMGDKNSTRSRNDNQNRASRRKDRPQIILFTENVRGLKRDEDLEAALASVGQRGGLAACWQETWRSGNERLECPGIGAVLLAGRDQQICNRGQEGVGIALSPAGVDAWKQAGQGRQAVDPALTSKICETVDESVAEPAACWGKARPLQPPAQPYAREYHTFGGLALLERMAQPRLRMENGAAQRGCRG